MSRKHKFDLTHMVHAGFLKDGETIFFVSDPAKTAVVSKQPNGEFKLLVGKETITVHALAQRLLGTEPPDHAARWFRTKTNHTLFQLWQNEHDEAQAA